MQTNKWKKDDPRFDQYIENLKKHGLQVNPSLKPAIFTLNNGLQYPGLRVQTDISGQNNLVTIPTNLLLTSHKARQQPGLSKVFAHPFYSKGQVSQDRILISYLLYINQLKDLNNIWYHMVQIFSKDIDILSFWGSEEIGKFCDKSIERAAMLQRDNFQKEWVEFQSVKAENEQFFSQFPEQAFGKDKYKWIYTHAVSRCFGSFMNSTYFTPFCEFFNHHCVDVSYQCVTQEQLQSIKIKKEQAQEESNKNTNQNSPDNLDDLSQTSSISSGNSVDYIEQGQFNYWEVESYKIKWGGKVSFELKQKQTAQVQKMYKDCLEQCEKLISWNGYNFVFLGQVIQKINIIKNQYMAGRKKFIPTKQQYAKTQSLVENYRSQALAFYRMMGGKYDSGKQKQSNLDNVSHSSSKNQQPQSVYQKSESPPNKQYKCFLMEAGPGAEFKQYEQIYFCYGRLSNRTMLVRYGCCIEENRYEHVWIKLPLSKVLSPYPDLFERVQQKGLPIWYKLKLRPTVWAYEMYLWLKVQRWELARQSIHQIFYPNNIQEQIQIFQQIAEIVKQSIPLYTKYENYEDLKDQSISYHEYFTRVYHKEKASILQKHLAMTQFVIAKLKLIQQNNLAFKYKSMEGSMFYAELKGYWKLFHKTQLAL